MLVGVVEVYRTRAILPLLPVMFDKFCMCFVTDGVTIYRCKATTTTITMTTTTTTTTRHHKLQHRLQDILDHGTKTNKKELKTKTNNNNKTRVVRKNKRMFWFWFWFYRKNFLLSAKCSNGLRLLLLLLLLLDERNSIIKWYLLYFRHVNLISQTCIWLQGYVRVLSTFLPV